MMISRVDLEVILAERYAGAKQCGM